MWIPATENALEIPIHDFGTRLQKALTHQNSTVRHMAVCVIGYYVHGEHVQKELLRIAENNPDDTVRNAAREALPKLERKRQYFSDQS